MALSNRILSDKKQLNVYNMMDKPGIIYLIKLNDNSIKIGITSKTVEKRYGDINISDKFELYYILFDKLKTAYELEQFILNKYIQHINYQDYGKFGWTEVINNIEYENLKQDINNEASKY